MNNKIYKFFGGMAAVAMLAIGMSSCSSELDNPLLRDKVSNVLAKAPKIEAYSGDTYWGATTRATGLTRGNGDNGVSWEKFTVQVDLQEESDYIDEKLPENGLNIEGVDYDFIFYSENAVVVEMCPVYAQTSTSNDFGIFYYDSNGTMHEEIIWDNITYTRLSYQQPNNMNAIRINIPAKTAFGFFIDKCTYHLIDDTEWSRNQRAYTSSSMNPESYFNINNNIDKSQTSRVHAVTWTETRNGVPTNYLGIEDWADFDYQDLVFTMTPDVKTVDASTYVPGEDPTDDPKVEDKNCEICGHPEHNPGECNKCEPGEHPECRPAEQPKEEDTNCDICGHPEHDPGNCDKCEPGKYPDCRPAEDPKDDPVPPVPPVVSGDNHRNEVEANLGIDDKEGKYTESHTSIHVRSANDVDLFIPIPLRYVCPADDMEIVQQHFAGLMDHGGTVENGTYDKDGKLIMASGLLSKMSYVIGDETQNWTVSLYVEYVAAGYTSTHGETFDEEGIHIWTEGIQGNTAMMDYLYEKFGDGITFEIWNYYNEGTTLDELKQYLDETTIKFLGDKLPDYFINAFGSANYEEGKDCDIHVDDSQADNYEFVGTGGHLNGSPYNDIYENKAHQPSPAE